MGGQIACTLQRTATVGSVALDDDVGSGCCAFDIRRDARHTNRVQRFGDHECIICTLRSWPHSRLARIGAESLVPVLPKGAVTQNFLQARLKARVVFGLVLQDAHVLVRREHQHIDFVLFHRSGDGLGVTYVVKGGGDGG